MDPALQQPRGSAAQSEVDEALRAVVLQTVRTLTAWLAPLFLLFVPFDYLYSGPHGPTLAALDAAIGLAYGGIHLVIRWRGLATRHAHLAAGTVALAALPYLIANLWVTGQPVFSAGLALWQMALGLILLSWPILLVLLALSNVAWALAAYHLYALRPSEDWVQYAFVLASATVMGIVAMAVRLRATRRLENLRLAERARRVELEEAQAAAREIAAVRRMTELKTQFINMAAHELATPMTPILLQMRVLRSELDGNLSHEQRRSMEIVERNLERLRVLLQDVLDGARLQADHLAIEFGTVDLHAVARHVVADYSASAEAAGVRLVFAAKGPVPVRGDLRRLQQVIANLVGNAVKFTPHGGRVEVRVEAAGKGAYVQVEDTGIGLARADIERLFQPFVQVHDTRTVSTPGTGLGLYITKGIVQRHGGEIGAKSDGPGKGSTFWFTIP